MERMFFEYGILGAIVFVAGGFLGLCIWRGGKWFGKTVITPIVDRHVAWINKSIEMMESQKQVIIMMTSLNNLMNDCAVEMSASHKDIHSLFATVHTNKALHYLGEANLKIAKEIGVDIEDLIQAMQDELKEQKNE